MKIATLLSFYLFIFLAPKTSIGTTAFIPNHGQITPEFTFSNSPIRYYSQFQNLRVFISDKGIIYQFVKEHPQKINSCDKLESANNKYDVFTFEMKLENCNQSANWQSSDSLPTRLNYYKGNCGRGLENIRPYQRIVLKNIYNKIDWEIICGNNNIKYNFIVHPGGNPREIRMNYSFMDSISLFKNQLQVETSLGKLIERRPVIIQNGQNYDSKFILNDNSVTFQIPHYNQNFDLIIDPGVEWSTYFGGSDTDGAGNVTTDMDQNVILSGITYSLDGIYSGGFQSSLNGNMDAFISKFDNNGSLFWSTYYGGEDFEGLCNTITDSLNYIYSALTTSSLTGIAYNGFQDSLIGGSDYALIKLDSQGIRVWSEYYDMGDPSNDAYNGIFLGKENNLFLYGNSSTLLGSIYHFISKFDTSGYHLHDTLLTALNLITSVNCDSNGDLILCGVTDNAGLAYNGFRDTIISGSDVYISKFSFGNPQPIWATYYGGNDYEDAKCVVDRNSNIYLYGSTMSTDFISYNGYQNSFQSMNSTWDGFVVKFNSIGQRQWGTYFGGKDNDIIKDGTFDTANNFIIVGETLSDSGVTKLAYKNNLQLKEAFLAEFNAAGDLQWSTYYGGSGYESASSCAVDTFDNIFMCGMTNSSDQIAINAFDSVYSGSNDAFLAKFNCFEQSQVPQIFGESNPDNFFNFIYTLDTTNAIGFEWEVQGGHILSGQYTDSVAIHWDSLGTGSVTGYIMYSQGCYNGSTFNTLVNYIYSTDQSGVQVYPNPAHDQFFISGENISQIKITDVTGKLIRFSAINKSNYAFNDLSPGMYFIIVTTQKEQINFKLLVE